MWIMLIKQRKDLMLFHLDYKYVYQILHPSFLSTMDILFFKQTNMTEIWKYGHNKNTSTT